MKPAGWGSPQGCVTGGWVQVQQLEQQLGELATVQGSLSAQQAAAMEAQGQLAARTAECHSLQGEVASLGERLGSQREALQVLPAQPARACRSCRTVQP